MKISTVTLRTGELLQRAEKLGADLSVSVLKCRGPMTWQGPHLAPNVGPAVTMEQQPNQLSEYLALWNQKMAEKHWMLMTASQEHPAVLQERAEKNAAQHSC